MLAQIASGIVDGVVITEALMLVEGIMFAITVSSLPWPSFHHGRSANSVRSSTSSCICGLSRTK